MHAYNYGTSARQEYNISERRVEERVVRSKERPRLYVRVIAVCMIAGIIGLGGFSREITVARLNRQVHTLERANYLLQQEVGELRAELALLESPYRVEEIARTELGMVYPSEQSVVWKVVPTVDASMDQPSVSFYESALITLVKALQTLSSQVLG